MLLQTTKPQLPHLQQGSQAAFRRSRGSQRTPRHRSPQAPSHVLTPGEELRGCSLSKSLKTLRDNVPHTLCIWQQEDVNGHNTFYSSLLQETQFTLPAVSLSIHVFYPPHARTGGQPWPQPGFPLPTHIPSLWRLFLVASNLSDIRFT